MDQLRRLVASLSLKQRIGIVATALAVVAGLAAFLDWNKERNFRPLYTDLSAEDTGLVLAKLKESGVEYRVGGSGSTILVPGPRVAELRLQMAAAGVPKTGRIGYELFDKSNFGVSDFAEQVNFRRALEGELERSVGTLSEVEQARVHITPPKDSVFTESRQPAKASVLVKLRPRASLSPDNVKAIEHLVASAVEGLTPDNISVLDMRGHLLSRHAGAEASETEASVAALQYRQKVEKDIADKIQATLDPVLGPDRFRAAVSVECDFTSGEQSEENWDPAKSVMTSSQRSEESYGGTQASGVPGTPSNLPRPSSRPGASGANILRRTENTTYQSSRFVKRLKLPQGSIRRVSVGLVLDQQVRWEGMGPKAKRTLVPPDAETMKRVHDLVASAVGISTERGDQVLVQSLPFETTLQQPPPPEPLPPSAKPAAPAKPGLKLFGKEVDPLMLQVGGGAALLTIVIALLAFRMLALKRKRKAELVRQATEPAVRGSAAAGHAGVPGTESGSEGAPKLTAEQRMQMQLQENADQRARQEEAVLEQLRIQQTPTKKSEVLIKHITEEAKRNPEAVAAIFRSLIAEREK